MLAMFWIWLLAEQPATINEVVEVAHPITIIFVGGDTTWLILPWRTLWWKLGCSVVEDIK